MLGLWLSNIVERSALNTPAEKPGLVGLSGRLRPLGGLMGQQACTMPIIEQFQTSIVKRYKG